MTVQENAVAVIDGLLQQLPALTTESPTSPICEVLEKDDIIYNAHLLPATHYVIGDEVVAEVEEDNVGYTLEFDLTIITKIEESIDPKPILRYFTGIIQNLIESNLQLDGQVNWVRYLGYVDFTKEINKPVSSRALYYRVQYRRKRGESQSKY